MNARITLRPLELADAAVSCRWRNDGRIWRHTGKRPDGMVTEEIEREWIKKVMADPTRLNFAICLKSDGTYIGNIYLVDIKGRTAELGVFIGEHDQQGKGYGCEALRLIQQEGFRRGIDEIRIRVRPENEAAIRSYRNAGAGYVEGQWIEMRLKHE